MDGSTALAILDKKINSVESTVQSVTLGSDKKSIVITTVDGVSFSVSIPNAVDNPTLLNKFTVVNGEVYYDGKRIAEYAEIPTATSQLTNDSGFITSANLPNLTPYQPKNDDTLATTNKTIVGAINELKTNVNNISVPTKTSQLTNDSGYITNSNIPTIPTKVSQLANDSNYVTQTEMTDAITDAVTGGTVDLTGYQKSRDTNLATTDKTVVGAINELKDNIDNFEGGGAGLTAEQSQKLETAYEHSQSTHVSVSDIPTKVSDLENDSSYVTTTEMNNAIANAQLGGGEGSSVDLSGYAQLSGATFTGRITSPEVSATNYFVTPSLVGEGDNTTYYHRVDFGHRNFDHCDFYEYGGIYNFYKNMQAGKNNAELLFGITPTKTTSSKPIYEGDVRVYSPNNKPTASDLGITTPTKVSQLSNDSGYVTTTEMNNAIGNAQLGGGEVDLSAYQQITDNNLKTTSKEVVGAINEINSRMGELTIYTDLAQLKLTNGITTTTIFNAMPNNSMLRLEVNSNTEVTDIPTNTSGILMIDKGKTSTGFDIQYKMSSNLEAIPNTLYTGQLKGGDGSGLTWRRICTTSIEDNKGIINFTMPSNITGIPDGCYGDYVIRDGWCFASFTIGVTKITPFTNYTQIATGFPSPVKGMYPVLYSENGVQGTQITLYISSSGVVKILAKGNTTSGQDFYLGMVTYPVKET